MTVSIEHLQDKMIEVHVTNTTPVNNPPSTESISASNTTTDLTTMTTPIAKGRKNPTNITAKYDGIERANDKQIFQVIEKIVKVTKKIL